VKSDAIAFALAGVAFGLIAGWVIGTQQAAPRVPAAPVQTSAAPPAAGSGGTTQATLLDEAQVTALTSVANREPTNAEARTRLANLYFDAEKYDEAIKWYAEAVRLAPKDVNVHTDLGVAYYYTNQSDKALEQFDQSLKLDPNHTKTLLNLGIVRAFGKQDLDGATKAWQQVLKLSPGSPEGQAARRALDTLNSAHPGAGAAGAAAQKPGD
jgi:cytochrome c-type biogenesis protein CcmH/NrfG